MARELRRNKTGNLRVTWHWGAFVQLLLQWKSNERYEYYTVCLFVALSIQQAIRMRLIVISSQPLSTTFFQIFSQTARF